MRQVYETTFYNKLCSYEKHLFEERAAIREFDGLMRKDLAENASLRDILELRWENKKNKDDKS
jgi:hypothetical protein